MQKRINPRQVGYDGKREMVPAWVDDAYVKGQYEPVVKNCAESTLALLYERGKIDAAQLQAGDWFRRMFEKMRMGSLVSNPDREPVSTSGSSDPIPDRMIVASRQLIAARAEIGRDGYRVVELVCGQGFTVKEAAIKKTQTEYRWTSQLFKRSLNRLAIWKGFATDRQLTRSST